MINWISGITGIIWGIGLIYSRLEEVYEGAPLYATGRIVALLFGIFLLTYGIIFIRRAVRQRKN